MAQEEILAVYLTSTLVAVILGQTKLMPCCLILIPGHTCDIPSFDTDINQDPISAGLGGENWLCNCGYTYKTDIRLAGICWYRQARKHPVKLSQCNRCKHFFW
ncbi:hypothetical protein J3R30DRAFT_3525998 [Lentinula aciculospora]|uniref:Uncharacterized protein n=1 Tax=Lentinula aciculospora TaxID=153920 RepID=A0A9W9A214_9AGAR|nr:hypothetical protein J3R30DRAFT_3525998 [Lentinula aciculospora]